MTGTDWEERMSQRAAERRASQRADHEEADEQRMSQPEIAAAVEVYVSQEAERIRTAGESLNVETYACACLGQPPSLPLGAPCYCALDVMARNRLRLDEVEGADAL